MDTLISVRDAARKLRVSESSIRRYFDEGKLQGHLTPAGTRRILKESVSTLQKQLGLTHKVGSDGITYP